MQLAVQRVAARPRFVAAFDRPRRDPGQLPPQPLDRPWLVGHRSDRGSARRPDQHGNREILLMGVNAHVGDSLVHDRLLSSAALTPQGVNPRSRWSRPPCRVLAHDDGTIASRSLHMVLYFGWTFDLMSRSCTRSGHRGQRAYSCLVAAEGLCTNAASRRRARRRRRLRRAVQPELAPREAWLSDAARSARGVRATPGRVAQTCVQETGCGTRRRPGVVAVAVGSMRCSRYEALAGGGWLARLTSEAITEAIRPCTPPGAFGARHLHMRSTYARHRIRHGIRHTVARAAGRRPRQCVPNDRLRNGPAPDMF